MWLAAQLFAPCTRLALLFCFLGLRFPVCAGVRATIERADYLVHMLSSMMYGGRKSQHSFVRAVDQNAAVQQLSHDRLRGVGRIQIHAQHQSHAADFAHAAMLRVKAFQFGRENSLPVWRMCLIIRRARVRNSIATAHASGPPPKVVPCIPGMHAAGDAIRGEHRSEGKTSGQRFRDSDDVRLDAVLLVGEPLPVRPSPH